MDEDGKKTDDYATPNCVKDVIDGWADNVDIAYKFEVRSDGTIGLYYDLRVTENACTTLRNIVDIENERTGQSQCRFLVYGRIFRLHAQYHKAFTEGYPAYNPLNLWMYKYSVKQGDKVDTSDFKNYTEKWNFVTEAPVRSYTVTVTGRHGRSLFRAGGTDDHVDRIGCAGRKDVRLLDGKRDENRRQHL